MLYITVNKNSNIFHFFADNGILKINRWKRNQRMNKREAKTGIKYLYKKGMTYPHLPKEIQEHGQHIWWVLLLYLNCKEVCYWFQSGRDYGWLNEDHSPHGREWWTCERPTHSRNNGYQCWFSLRYFDWHLVKDQVVCKIDALNVVSKSKAEQTWNWLNTFGLFSGWSCQTFSEICDPEWDVFPTWILNQKIKVNNGNTPVIPFPKSSNKW